MLFEQADLVTVHAAADILDVSADTIRRWEKKGLIPAQRSENNHRLFRVAQLKKLKKRLDGEEVRKFQVLKSKPTEFTALELFAGAGGLALGLENAGLQTILASEIDNDCVETLRTNRKWYIEHGDVADVSFKKYKGLVDVVTGGFPCQAFSYAGNKLGFNDTRGTLFYEFARCVKETKPRIAVAENVRGLVSHDNGRTLKTMVNVLEGLGYRVRYKLFKAQFFDVAQKRERLVIYAFDAKRIDKLHVPEERDYIVTLAEALKGCPESHGSTYPERKREIMDQVPEGGNWRDLPISLQKEYMKGSFYLGGGKTGMARRLAMNEPSLTLTCNPAQKQTERCHPKETRPLSVREYARIQSFPDSWEFKGSITSQYKQIGNAVPVNMGYYIGRGLLKSIGGETDDCEKFQAIS